MRFTEIDLFGVYVAPISVMMIGAWLIFLPLRQVAVRLSVLRRVWHPVLFEFAVYMTLLSVIVLFISY